ITGPIKRAYANESTEDRGAESSLGNLIADIQLWATSNESFAGVPAQIGIMNSGGLRADLEADDDGGPVTYREVAAVQPFANTLVTMDLTGAQLKKILELQWKPAPASRPKLHLGISEGFEYWYTETDPRSGVIHQMRHHGEVIQDDDVVRVVTNSFLAAGGDGVTPFAQGTNRADTGQVDLAATIAYFEAHDVVDPAPLGRAKSGQPPALPEQPVEKVATSVTAVIVPKKIDAANKATAVALVSGAKTGTVEFRSGSTLLATAKVTGGEARAKVSPKVGTHRVTAHFLENETHLGSVSTPKTLKVVKAASSIKSVER